jgi:hypothetical protein
MLAYNGKVVTSHIFNFENYLMELYEIGTDKVYAKIWQSSPSLHPFS